MRHLSVVLVALAVLAGCRREDIREFDVEVEGLTPAMMGTVYSAFMLPGLRPSSPARVYEGVFKDDIKFDFDRHVVTVRYDSMKIARQNIRVLLENKGLKVVYPENTTGKAGY